jgi:hypothetical protein
VHVREFVERNDHADIDETGTVEEQVNDVGKHTILCSFVEETAVTLKSVSHAYVLDLAVLESTYSQANALPQAKAANKSSLPRRVQIPVDCDCQSQLLTTTLTWTYR